MAGEVTLAQDIIRCALCEQAGDYHCKPCQSNLCCECISYHLSDKTNKHEVVELVSQQKHYNCADMPECSSHESYICDVFCKDCNIPICIKCLTRDHRQHNFISLEDFLDEKKSKMLNEIQEIESRVLPEFQKYETGVDDEDYEKTIEAISAHEDLICNIVREAGSKIRDQVVQHKTNNLEIIKKNASAEKALLSTIHDTWLCLVRNDPKEIFELRRLKFQMNAKCSEVNWHIPYFQVQNRQGWEISSFFGTLHFEKEQDVIIRGENLYEQPWYHGYISSEEAEELLKKNGDFLVWEVGDSTEEDCFVITTYQNGPIHIKITPEVFHEMQLACLGDTLVDTIKHVYNTGRPLSVDLPYILKYQVDRHHNQLDYGEVQIGQQIEIMTSGHILARGTYGEKKVLVIPSENEKKLLKNLTVMRYFNHENIVRMEAYSALRKPILLFAENMSESLLSFLRQNDQTFPNKRRIQMCLDVAKGMAYLHQENFIHRDIAARNCLVSDDGVVKIFDFWMTERGERYQIRNGEKIPIKWAAPEVILADIYTHLSDVWSFGVLMWEILSLGLEPYGQMSHKETVDKVLEGYRMEAPKDTQKTCYSLMLNCWEKIPEDRYQSEVIVKKLQKIIQSMYFVRGSIRR